MIYKVTLLCFLAIGVVLQSQTATAYFGKGLVSPTGKESFVSFWDEPSIVAWCGEILYFGEPAVLLKGGLCDDAATRKTLAEDAENHKEFVIPGKSVGRLLFANGDCDNGRTLEVNVVCNEHNMGELTDSSTGDALMGMISSVIPDHGRVLISQYEHEVDWSAPGPYAPIEADCGDVISFAWTSADEHSLYYMPDGACPTNWYAENNTGIMLHELATEGMYVLQMPLDGTFSMFFADSAMDGFNCLDGHYQVISVDCTATAIIANETEGLALGGSNPAVAMAPGPSQKKSKSQAPAPAPGPATLLPSFTSDYFTLPYDESEDNSAALPSVPKAAPKMAPAQAPLEVALGSAAPAPKPPKKKNATKTMDEEESSRDLVSGAPAPAPETGSGDYYSIEDMESNYPYEIIVEPPIPAPPPEDYDIFVDYELGPELAPAPAPMMEYDESDDLGLGDLLGAKGDDEETGDAPAPGPAEDVDDGPGFRDIPRPLKDYYDYYDLAPRRSTPDDPDYVYYYQELDVPAAPGVAPVLKRIKRKSGDPTGALTLPADPPIPQPKTFADFESDSERIPNREDKDGNGISDVYDSAATPLTMNIWLTALLGIICLVVMLL